VGHRVGQPGYETLSWSFVNGYVFDAVAVSPLRTGPPAIHSLGVGHDRADALAQRRIAAVDEPGPEQRHHHDPQRDPHVGVKRRRLPRLDQLIQR
jgi:hypothetical protein